jgi:hypothetical protein
LSSPLRLRRVGLASVCLAALLSAFATWLRGHRTEGTVGHSATYLLDVAALFLAIAGAAIEARVGDLLLAAGVRAGRRRAIAFSVSGLGAALAGCVTLSAASSGASAIPLRAALAAMMTGGFGVGLGGLATLGVFYAGRYAENRIERLGEDDW